MTQNDSEKKIILHIHPGCYVFYLKIMLFEHLFAKSFK